MQEQDGNGVPGPQCWWAPEPTTGLIEARGCRSSTAS